MTFIQKVSVEGVPLLKCHSCHHIIYACNLIGGTTCPICGGTDGLIPMCHRDHLGCAHDLTSGIAYCPDCGEPMCPVCESHDVYQISRVTGYMQEVSGWNNGKQQELKDRTRYDPFTGDVV